ncbi:MAG: DUF503 domain-containing protein [Chloroflexi bacterium]|nr:DUF503 domain-containing protein [Chloroflexota bacterium]
MAGNHASLGLLLLQIELPGCSSLKEKRSRLKPLLARLRREFNISAAEIDRLDDWDQAVIGCALLSNQAAFNQRSLLTVLSWVEANWPDVAVFDHSIETF